MHEKSFSILIHVIMNGVVKKVDYKCFTVKPVLSGHSKRTPKLIFNTYYRLMQVKSIAEFLQYFRPALSYHFPSRPLFCLLLSDRLRQVLLYSFTNFRRSLMPVMLRVPGPKQTSASRNNNWRTDSVIQSILIR